MSETRDLLIEIGTEELPPKALSGLASAFAEGLHTGLEQTGLGHNAIKWYATPRRLALLVTALPPAQQDRETLRRGPALAVAYDKSGKPTKAATGFAHSCGVGVDQLQILETDKGKWLSYQVMEQGKPINQLLPGLIAAALTGLPIPKRMRWGDGDEEFVRPVHWVVVLYGSDVIACSILGVSAGRETRGHRFHHPGTITLSDASEYITRLRQEGFVIVDHAERKTLIREKIDAATRACAGIAHIEAALLDEVTALVEWPVAIMGSFDNKYLQLPREVLIATMQGHQKYFPVMDAQGQLLEHFITIANIESRAPDEIRKGNERVIGPRLSDAAFFRQRDCAKPLIEYSKGLKDVIFEKKLGTLADKTGRIEKLAMFLAAELGLAHDKVKRAAALAKCDLLTDMVGEFPELQGCMGRYYALASHEEEEIALAIDEQYLPRQAGAGLPRTKTGQLLSIADKLDTLSGIFAIGQPPTGDKDPYALRRAAIGCLRIMIECELDLDLETCLMFAAGTFDKKLKADSIIADVFDFMMERLRRYYIDTGTRYDVFDSVLARRPTRPYDFQQRIHAVTDFVGLPEAQSLAAANKRIKNILKQAGADVDVTVREELLQEPAEQQLHKLLSKTTTRVKPLLEKNDYTNALKALAGLRDAVDAFFDQVMVMCDDDDLKNNRVALLKRISNLFLSTADISRLQ